MIDWLINFDSSAWILHILDKHWLAFGFLGGAIRIVSKRTTTKVDDELVSLVDDLKHARAKDQG